MRQFKIRYEKEELECSKAIGKSMFEGEAKGFHLLEQANLSENQKQMVLAACGKGKLEYEVVSQIMKRIFEGLGNKEDNEWWGSEGYSNVWRGRDSYRPRSISRGRGTRGRGRDGKNPLNRDGRVSLCTLCKSEYHWVRDCPQNVMNKTKKGKEPS